MNTPNSNELYLKAYQDGLSMKPSFMLVTPEMALGWLKKNTRNRKLRPGGVAVYAAEIKAGRWQPIHQGIAFSVDGTLVDGQTRLNAIVETGITVPLMVTFGLPRGSMEAVDRGMTRSVPDILRLEYDMENTKRINALVSVIASVAEGDPLKMTAGRAMEIYRQWKPHIDWALTLPQTGKLWKAPIVAAFTIARRRDQQEVESIAVSYREGVDLFDGMAAHYLRRQLLEQDRDRKLKSPSRLARWVLTVIYHGIEGRITRVSSTDDSGYEYYVTDYKNELSLEEGVES